MSPGRSKFTFSSRLTLVLLLLLRRRSLPTHMLTEYLGLESKYVSSYLCYLRKLGFVRRDGFGFWLITDLGLSYLENVEKALSGNNNCVRDLAKQLANFRINKKTKINKRKQKKTRKNKKKQKKTKEIQNSNRIIDFLNGKTSFEKFLEKVEKRMNRPLTEVEFRLISFLWRFQETTGRKYWWPPGRTDLASALAEELRISSSNIGGLEEALRELESKGIIYITYDKRRGVAKIRIDRSLEG